MRRLIRLLLLMVFSLTIITASAGCAAREQALRDDGSRRDKVRFFSSQADPIGFRSEKLETQRVRPEQPVIPQELFSAGDDARGRWLTLFEVDFTPVGAGSLPNSAEGQ